MTDQIKPALRLSDVTRVCVVTEEDRRVLDHRDAYPDGCEVHITDEGRTIKILPITPQTLAGELLAPDGTDEDVDGVTWIFSPERMRTLAARAEQMERELSEARAERDEARSVADEQIDLHDEASAARAEAEAVAARHYENLRLALADARAEVEQLTKDMLSMVPAPRVITDPEELEKLAEGTVILESGAKVLQKRNGRWYYAGSGVDYGSGWVIAGVSVVVLWEPEEGK